MKDKFLSLCGLCRKANMLAIGTNLSVEALKNNKVHLVVMAVNIAKNSEKEIVKETSIKSKKLIKTSYSKEELGLALGYNEVAVFAVTDEIFAKALEDII